jgi:L-glutamine-phosphate cytidylyltransferase
MLFAIVPRGVMPGAPGLGGVAMKTIIIGAGRGRRLRPLTDDTPKCYAEVGGRRILDWGLESLRANGLTDVVFVGGYQIDRVRSDYPELSFRHNTNWENNNILASLFYAEDAMADGFICSYADILYRPALIAGLLAAPGDVALVVDTSWRQRYERRSEHPENDAEKVLVEAGRLARIGRDVAADQAHGEFVGLAKFSPAGATILRQRYQELRAGRPSERFSTAAAFEKAYLIDILQDLIERGTDVRAIDTAGGYFEVDTTQDFQLAQESWR